MCICITCIQYLWSPEEDVESPGIGVMVVISYHMVAGN